MVYFFLNLSALSSSHRSHAERPNVVGKPGTKWFSARSFADFFLSARLLPFKKKDDGVRPIAVGEVLRRIFAKIAFNLQYINNCSYSPQRLPPRTFQKKNMGSSPSNLSFLGWRVLWPTNSETMASSGVQSLSWPFWTIC